MEKQKSIILIETNKQVLIKADVKYPWMFYYIQTNNRWSKDYYNYTRASWYAAIETDGPKLVGQLPYRMPRRAP